MIVLALTATGAVAASAAQDTSWWPSLRPLDEAAPVRTADEERQTFVLAPGYHAELVASEPLVEDPVVLEWDPAGRLWVVEMPGYMIDMRATDELQPTGRVVVLDDTDGDGTMDRRTVFADGLFLPRALKVLDRGVLVAEPPMLWLYADTDGDLVADERTAVTDRYGRREANVEHNTNGLLWALDNWMYTSEGDTYLRLKQGRFEVAETLSRGQWGVSQDDVGRVYRNTNSSALFVDLVPARYFMRHPHLLRTRGLYESLGGSDLNRTWPLMPSPGVNRGYEIGILRDDQTLASFTAVNSPTVYRGDRLPADLYGNVFLAEPTGQLISRVILEDDGRTLVGRKAYEGAEFMGSTDERFRPVYLSSAPDGTLYIADMYRGVIQHRGYLTEYLRDQIVARNLETPIHRGRVWRVVHDTTTRSDRPSLDTADVAELVATLSHPNGWWRDTAQRLLVERADPASVEPLMALAEAPGDVRARLHALWALDGMDRLQPDTVIDALEAESRDVRVSALQLSERWLATDARVQEAVLGRLDDSDWHVRQQLAATLGVLPADRRAGPLATVLARYGADPIVMDAAISSANDLEAGVIRELLAGEASPEKEGAVAMLVATVVRGGDLGEIQPLLSGIGDVSRPRWQREALLRGGEVAWLGAPAPGTPPPPVRDEPAEPPPCPTCPGAHDGPGGAQAFPLAPTAPATTTPAGEGGGRGNQRRRFSLSAEPSALLALPADDPLAERAAALVERLTWPGRPATEAGEPARVLTAEEQQRFAAGGRLYQNLCQACHQADGSGRAGEQLALSLVGSAIVLGSDAITARVVLNGMEGPVGLMPPLGATMSDADIAAVLTYVRRSWGQAGEPVTAETVGDVREATAGRTRPWTAAELQAIE